MPKVLITGCGRSGTLYAQKVLNHAGLQLGHEVEGVDGTVDWHKAWDTEGYDVVLHQVRHPLKVLGSLRGIRTSSWAFIHAADPGTPGNEVDNLLRIMRHWISWNSAAEASSLFTYQVERLIETLPRISEAVGREFVATPEALEVPTDTHTRPMNKPPITLQDLRDACPKTAAELNQQARRYGYEL